MKTVGIIGGLGPQTSAEFYLEIVNSFVEMNSLQKPQILLWNVPIPIKVEEDLLLENFGAEKFLPFLIQAAEILEKAGADFLVMPCNTMHIFIDKIRNVLQIPVLSIIDETVSVIKNKDISRIGVLATSTTLEKELFRNKLKAINVKEEVPNKKQQQKLDEIIHRLVTSRHNHKDKIEINKIIKGMVKLGIKHIILACTDLQIIIKRRSDVQILDTMKILADATVIKINE